VEDATELALDRPLWRLLAASGAYTLNWRKLNNNDDDDMLQANTMVVIVPIYKQLLTSEVTTGNYFPKV